MNCIVIDDEPYALNLIKDYVLKTPSVDLMEVFSDPFKALNFLNNNHVDLIFLDINMPELSGIQLLESLPYQPRVIFTTAYREYGAESYNYNAIDYLLKPIKYERFLKAVNKVQESKKIEKNEFQINKTTNQDHDNLFIKSGTKIHKVEMDDILYVEGAGNYMTVHLKDTKILTLLKMTDILNQLPSDKFIRIHKSYIVSFKHIDIIEKHQVVINKKAIPVGITFREHFFNKISHRI
ncbi:MAG: response regulator transcription factor [Bacteroidales bacterium]|jgi:DNA-binding LytR/AlgR family response regulator|nr:response regulator transcription factor [Bacteroidales bacterium]